MGHICECYIYGSYLLVFSRARPYFFWHEGGGVFIAMSSRTDL